MGNFDLDFGKYINLFVDGVIGYTPKIFIAFAIWIIGFRVIKILLKLIRTILIKQKVAPAVRGFLNSLTSIALKVLILITVAITLGVPMTSFIAILGAAGLAIGLSLQGSLANFAGGVLILLFKPFKIGDYIATSSHSGTVEKIAIFNTTLITIDNKVVIIPNGNLSNKEITNYTAKKTRRLDLVFGVSYDDDLQKVRGILEKIVKADKRIVKDPKPLIVVGELGESSVNFFVRSWCKTEDYWDIKFDLLEKVKLEFDKEKISIPYPQMDIHMKK
jgi:small conductance mechanosensitive channel